VGAEPVYHEISHCGQHLWRGPASHATAVFAEGFVAHPVLFVLDAPMTAIPTQKRLGIRSFATNTCDSIRHFGRRLAFASGRADDLADLLHPRPIEVIVQHRGVREFSTLNATVPLVERAGRLAFGIHLTLLRGGKRPPVSRRPVGRLFATLAGYP
jgi:hypothetical protein